MSERMIKNAPGELIDFETLFIEDPRFNPDFVNDHDELPAFDEHGGEAVHASGGGGAAAADALPGTGGGGPRVVDHGAVERKGKFFAAVDHFAKTRVRRVAGCVYDSRKENRVARAESFRFFS